MPVSYTHLAQEQEILWAAALLHDVEKRSTSVDEGGGCLLYTSVERETGPLNRTLLPAVISLQGGDYHALIEDWEGSVQWIAKSPYRIYQDVYKRQAIDKRQRLSAGISKHYF